MNDELRSIGCTDCALAHPVCGILDLVEALTAEEFAELRRHPAIGDELLTKVPVLRRFRPAVRHHHERWDGRGYPDGLAGEAIPLSARIVCVADSYDAMTSTRPYRERLCAERAAVEILECAGSQFDPQIARAMLRLLAAKKNPIRT